MIHFMRHLFGLLFAALLCAAGGAHAQSIVSPTIAQVLNGGSVYAIFPQTDGKLVIGGNFSFIGTTARNSIARFNSDGTLDSTWNPDVNGTVKALAIDHPNGLVYIAGQFTAVGGTPRNNLARVTMATGAVDSWNPSADGPVNALCLDGKIFVGGSFTSVGGASRSNLALLSPAGTADATWSLGTNGVVHALRLDPSTSTIFVGGAFTTVGGQPRNNIARLVTTGAGTVGAWNANADGAVRAIVYDFTNGVFLGGDFNNVGGLPRQRLAKVSPSAPTTTDATWNPGPNGTVNALELDGVGNLFVGGDFGSISGQSSLSRMAKISQTGTGAADPSWNIGLGTGVNTNVYTIVVQGQVLIGGRFQFAGGTARGGFAATGVSSSTVATNYPKVLSTGIVSAVSRDSSGRTVIGGLFMMLGDKSTVRLNLARFNSDGTLDSAWDPGSDEWVFALAHDSSGSLYVGGQFSKVGGLARSGIAKVSSTGVVDATWNPGGSFSYVWAMAPDNAGNLYVGGPFSSIGGQARSRIAKLSTTGTGNAEATWNPSASGFVRALLLDGPSLYVGGSFASIGGVARNNVAKLATSGAGNADATWDANVGGTEVRALAMQGLALYIGGQYSTVGGQSRNNLAMVALSGNGALDATWNPSPNGGVEALLSDGAGNVFAGGQFTSIGGLSRARLARVSASGAGAAAIGWLADANSSASALAYDSGTGRLHVGGFFTTLAGSPQYGFGVLSGTAASTPVITSAPPGNGTLGQAYLHTYVASGTPPLTFQMAVGGLPPGLALTSTTGLISGTPTVSGTFTGTVIATNSVGSGSQPFSITIATLPGAPVIGLASAGNAQAVVSFTPPGNDGGSAITSYTVTSNPGSITATGTASPITVTGLTNGTTYTFTVKATNAIGSSPSSAASNSVMPATTPGAPTIGTATAGNGQATVTFTAPASNGGAAITSHTVTSNPGALTATSVSSPIAVTGLTNGTAYTFTVTATNIAGTGPSSGASNSVTPSGPVIAPSAPTVLTATPGNGQATITFSAPTSNGGAPITSYAVSCTPGPVTATGSGAPITVAGLSNGTLYSCSVRAINSAGVGAASGSIAVAPAAPATSVPAISTSASHTLALDADGKVYAWGNDSLGQLGQGRLINRVTPVQVSGLPAVTRISMHLHGLAIDAFKQVWSWGDNSCGGQLGPREGAVTSKPGRVIGASNMTRVAAALCYSLALRSDGTVHGWGFIPGASSSSGTGLRQIVGFTGITEIAAGYTHALALRSDGTVWAAGENTDGQLGLGSTGTAQAPTVIPSLSSVTAIAAGLTASLTLHADGSLRFWGRSENNVVVTTPTLLPAPGGTPVSIWLANRVPIVALSNGQVAAYNAATSTWQTKASLSGIVRVANASDLVLGINGAGQLYALSANNYAGQLGQGNTNPSATAVPVPGFASTTMAVTSASTDAAMALKADGTVWFWGAETHGQSGDGTAIASSVPLPVTIPATIRAIAAGDRFSLALDSEGNVWGWGENAFGPFGSQLINRSTPALIAGISSVTAIAAGGRGLALFLKSDGSVWKSGTLPQVSGPYDPAAVPGLSSIVKIAAGNSAYALRNDGALYFWGIPPTSGFEGSEAITTPTAITGISGTITSISAGSGRAGAVTSDGTVWTWGAGILGNGTSAGSATPVQVPGIVDATDISIGSTAVAVRRRSGSLYAWGQTALAEAVSANQTLPFAITFHEPVRLAILGANHSIGFLVGSKGIVWGFGFGNASLAKASIGDGGFVPRTRPVVVLAPNAGGSIDADNWYLDLDRSTSETIPTASIPKSLGVSRLFGSESGLSLEATVKYRASDLNKRVNIYVLAQVPAEFFGLTKSAPGTPSVAQLKKRQKDGVTFAQLTPQGWANVTGQLIAYSQATANASGGAANILNGINATQIPGARFCIGYGENSSSMLSAQNLAEVLTLEGAASSSSGVPCVLSGLYVDGPTSSTAGSSVTFRGTVVGLNPTGTVQFKDGAAALQAAVTLSASNDAVGTASVTSNLLTPGSHSIGAFYSGDTQNSAISAEIPILHSVVAAAPGATVTKIAGAASSDSGSTATFTATVTGSSPTGTVQFKDAGANLGDAVPVVEGAATLRTSALAVGSHSLTATYNGDSANAASSSTAISHTIFNATVTSVSLTSSTATAELGGAVTLTATVVGTSPTGTVTFRDGSTSLGTGTLTSAVATLTTTSLESGPHAITAEYGGDGTNQAVTSAATFVTISVPGQLNMSPTSYAYGGQSLGTTQTNGFVVFNTTSGTVTVSSVTVTAGFSVSHDCSSLAVGATCTATVSFTPASETPASGTLTVVTSAGTQSATLSGQGEKSLVSHYYRSILRRAPDAGGKAFWESEAARVGGLGANVNETWYAMAMSFYFSAEYLAFNRNPTEYVRDLYGTFFNRAADNGGLDYWTGQMASGLPREVVLVGFMFSTEFANFASAIFGNTAARAEVDTVVDFYRGLLSRLPDSGGFNYWLGQFRTAQCGGAASVYTQVEAISLAYAESPEYTGRNRTNTQYVADMYNAFLRRGGDLAGVQFWIGQLDTGARTRSKVRQDFIASPEFSQRVANIISAGCLQ